MDIKKTDLDVKNVEEGYTGREAKETLPGGQEPGTRETLDEICNDPNYELANSHLNVKGDYTLVFKHKYGGKSQTFANCRLDSLPNNVKEQVKE
ncbi:hypothetical protein ABK040_001159 [Willaertia magna]